MSETLIIISALALILAVIALIVALAALAFIIGVKNSTHQVVWKPVEPAESQDDPFSTGSPDEDETEFDENPNKRFKKFTNDVKTEEPFVDLDDPSEVSFT